MDMRKILFIVLLLCSINMAYAVSISVCSVLSSANTVYNLTTSVAGTGSCMNITASNVTLDCGGNTINYSSAGGVVGYGVNITTGVNFATVKNCVIKEGNSGPGSKFGININSSNNDLITNNTFLMIGSSSTAIYLLGNVNNTNITNNIITDSGASGMGVYLVTGCNLNNISNNYMNITGGSANGIRLEGTSNSNYMGNNSIITSQGSAWGIILTNSWLNTVTNNSVYSLWAPSYVVQGTNISHYNNTITTSNLAEGKPVNYTYNAQNLVYNNLDFTTSGQVIFAWSRNITINNSNFTSDSLSFFYTNNSFITGNRVTVNSSYGIFLYQFSTNNYVFNNTVLQTSGQTGHDIYLFQNASFNNITNNIVNVTGQNSNGIYVLTNSIFNNINNNTVSSSANTGMGIQIAGNSNSNNINGGTINTYGSTGMGLRFETTLNNMNITNLVINTYNASASGIYFSQNNLNLSFVNVTINTYNNSAYPIFISANNANFTFKDSYMNASPNTPEVTVANTVNFGLWNFTNVTHPDGINPLDVNWSITANGTFISNYYFDVLAYNITNNLSGINITAKDGLGNIVSNELTNASGRLSTKILPSYIAYNISAYIYYSNYSMNASAPLYNNYTNNSINLSTNIFVNAFMQLTCVSSLANTSLQFGSTGECLPIGFSNDTYYIVQYDLNNCSTYTNITFNFYYQNASCFYVNNKVSFRNFQSNSSENQFCYVFNTRAREYCWDEYDFNNSLSISKYLQYSSGVVNVNIPFSIPYSPLITTTQLCLGGVCIFNWSNYKNITASDTITSTNIVANGNLTGNTLYGAMEFHSDVAPNVTLLPTTTTFYNLTAFNTQANQFRANNGATNATNALVLSQIGTYMITMSGSVSGNVSGDKYHIALFANGIEREEVDTHFKVGTSAEIYPFSVTGVIGLPTNSKLWIAVKDETTAANISVYSLQLSATRVGN